MLNRRCKVFHISLLTLFLQEIVRQYFVSLMRSNIIEEESNGILFLVSFNSVGIPGLLFCNVPRQVIFFDNNQLASGMVVYNLRVMEFMVFCFKL